MSKKILTAFSKDIELDKKIATSSLLTREQRNKLEILKEKKAIKSMSAGIREAVSQWLKKQDIRIKGQKTLLNYNKNGKD